MRFKDISYLSLGTARQREAFTVLTNNSILSKMDRFDPILAGTIPINIDIEGSDLDIICCFENAADFIDAVKAKFSNEKKFMIEQTQVRGQVAVVANFFIDGLEIEIFGQNIPTKDQFAYRHLIIEEDLLKKYGTQFRSQIIALKRQGYKTEPAFAKALGLSGDPYTALLKFEVL